jgi:chemotaxis protein methyltransferase CheR
VTNLECAAFLQRYLPQMGFRWPGFRKVHKQVCRRLSRRMNELGLSGFPAYTCYLRDHPEERQALDVALRITISRFYRDRGVFDMVCSKILPELANEILLSGGRELRCWSAGCCSGEEPYTLQVLWKLCVVPLIRRDLTLRIIATDINHEVLKRAKEGYYSGSSLRDLPEELVWQAFTRSGEFYTIKRPFTENIEFTEQDIRKQLPEGSFHVIFCRNLVFTYFEEALQREILDGILGKLCQGGIFIIGIRESVPKGVTGIVRYNDVPGIFKKEG